MLQNNLDPEVAEKPAELIVYGGRGKAARDWDAYHRICATLERLADHETLLVQSGKPVAVLETHPMAPRVLIANSNLVPRWATWEEFDRLDRLGLAMYGQMTAGSWIYIGTQGILQGTYETFAAAADKHFGGTLAGTVTLTAGLGGMGGAQPLAVTLAGGVALCVEVDPARIRRRLETRYLDEAATSLDDALAARRGREARAPRAVDRRARQRRRGAARARRGAASPRPRHRPDERARPDVGLPAAGARGRGPRRAPPPAARRYLARARDAMAEHVRAILAMQRAGAVAFDYGNNLRAQAQAPGVADAFAYPGFVPAFIRDSFCEGRGPVPLGGALGRPGRHRRHRRRHARLFPDDARLQRWLGWAGDRIAFQGLPARICWLGYRERDRAGRLFNAMVRDGRLKAPVVIGRDHLDAGSVASPYRETEAMKDGSDAVSDWALLNFAVGTASGAAWMSFHHGGGVGWGTRSTRARRGRRRQRRGRRAAAALPDQRPGDGRGAPRRRGLRDGARRGARPRARPAERGGVTGAAPAAPTPAGPPSAAQRRVHDLLDGHPEAGDPLDVACYYGLLGAIVVAIGAMVGRHTPRRRGALGRRPRPARHPAGVLFAAEYLARVWAAPADPRYRGGWRGRVRFVLSPLALLDLAAAVALLLPHLPVELSQARLVRLFALLRVGKLGRFGRSLAVASRVFRSRRDDLLLAAGAVASLLFVGSSLVYYAEHEAQPDKFGSIPEALWWGVATVTTVGYGDVYPITTLGRVLGGLVAVLGIASFSLPTAILGAAFLDEVQRGRAAARGAACDACGRPYADAAATPADGPDA
jgi:urocanate hydratase